MNNLRGGIILAQSFKRTSMQDIADCLGISKNAVSLALNNKSGVSDGLRKKITKTAEELRYPGFYNEDEPVKNSIIIATADYITKEDQFYYDIIWAIEKEVRLRGADTIITNIEPHMEEQLELPKLLFKSGITGVILLGIIRKEYVEAVINTGASVVLVDNYYDDIICDAVVTANVEAAYNVVKYLIEKGHQKIGYIGAKDITASSYSRWIGYCKKMNENNLEVNTDYCLTEAADVSYSQEQLREFVESLTEYPTAWFCSNDYIAAYLINVLREKSIKVPEDISIVGFDDVNIAHIIDPKLTTVKVKRDLMSKKAVELLLVEKNDNEKIKIMTYADLVIRDSVKEL